MVVIRWGPHSRPGTPGRCFSVYGRSRSSVYGRRCRVESRLVAERRGRAGTGHGYRHTGSHPFTPAVHHHRQHQHQHHQQSSAYIYRHPAYWPNIIGQWAMDTLASIFPNLSLDISISIPHGSHPSNLFVSFHRQSVCFPWLG